MQNFLRRLMAWLVVIALLLCIPLVAMQFTNDVQWSPLDFVFMSVLLFGTTVAYELVASQGKGVYRIAVAIAVLTSFVLIWVNAAVGIIGDGPVNLMYLGVIAVGFFGTILSFLKPRGMALTAFAMAFAQALVPVIAIIFWPPPAISWAPGVTGVFTLNAVFVVLFVGSGLLFQRVNATSSK